MHRCTQPPQLRKHPLSINLLRSPHSQTLSVLPRDQFRVIHAQHMFYLYAIRVPQCAYKQANHLLYTSMYIVHVCVCLHEPQHMHCMCAHCTVHVCVCARVCISMLHARTVCSTYPSSYRDLSLVNTIHMTHAQYQKSMLLDPCANIPPSLYMSTLHVHAPMHVRTMAQTSIHHPLINGKIPASTVRISPT